MGYLTTRKVKIMNIQWFPGHMAKTRKQIAEDLKLVDIIYELTDARVPESGRNPEIDSLAQSKPRILILNKCDMADDVANNKWVEYYNNKGIKTVLVSAINGLGINKLNSITSQMLEEKAKAKAQKGIVGDGIRAMIVGIPNVGKSSLINKLSGRAGTKTGDRPGVTKGKQWITLKNGTMLLDTPGILWPKFEDAFVGQKLAFTGAIKDEIIDIEELALNFIDYMKSNYPENLKERYKLTDLDKETVDIMFDIGKKRGCVISGGDIDYTRASKLIMDDFRSCNLGKITLEFPEER